MFTCYALSAKVIFPFLGLKWKTAFFADRTFDKRKIIITFIAEISTFFRSKRCITQQALRRKEKVRQGV
jgi:hypothetical protein